MALVMLGALSMLAVWGFNSSSMNARVVYNSEARQEALAAAQTALETTISSDLFSSFPQEVAAAPITVDLNGDGIADQTATLSPPPRCFRVRVVPKAELDVDRAEDRVCMVSGGTHGREGDSGPSPDDMSMCAHSEWHLRAVVADPRTGAAVAVNQGIAMRGKSTDSSTHCPGA